MLEMGLPQVSLPPPAQGSWLHYMDGPQIFAPGPRGLLKTQIGALLHPFTPASNPAGPGWDLRMCISNRFQGAAAGLGATPCTSSVCPASPLCPSLGTTKKKARMDGPFPAMPWAKCSPSWCQPQDLPEKALPTPTQAQTRQVLLIHCFAIPRLIIL